MLPLHHRATDHTITKLLKVLQSSAPHLGGIPVSTLKKVHFDIADALINSASQPSLSDPSVTSLREEVMVTDPLWYAVALVQEGLKFDTNTL